jgi:Flp pilus assembly protein TadB
LPRPGPNGGWIPDNSASGVEYPSYNEAASAEPLPTLENPPRINYVGLDAIERGYGKAKKGLYGLAWRWTFAFWRTKLAILITLIVLFAIGWLPALIVAVLSLAFLIWYGQNRRAKKRAAKQASMRPAAR